MSCPLSSVGQREPHTLCLTPTISLLVSSHPVRSDPTTPILQWGKLRPGVTSRTVAKKGPSAECLHLSARWGWGDLPWTENNKRKEMAKQSRGL